MARKRKDSDRRSRQCAKFARLIKIARLVMGNGRWGPEDLAREIECSERTIYRDVEILTVSGMPIIYDKAIKAYRVREGFRFSGLEPQKVDTRRPGDSRAYGQRPTSSQRGRGFLRIAPATLRSIRNGASDQMISPTFPLLRREPKVRERVRPEEFAELFLLPL